MSQYLLNGAVMYGWVAIIAISFRLIYRVAGFFHFAHGLAIATGPYCLFILLRQGISFVPALFLALFVAGAVGACIHSCIYHPISRHGMHPLALMLASLGVYLIGQNVISLLCGDDPLTPRHALIEGGVPFFGGRISNTNLTCLLMSFPIALAAGPVLSRTTFGTRMRAVACDRSLAKELGVPMEQVLLRTYFVGSVVAAFGGIMIAYDTGAKPTMGLDALLPGVVAVVLGGDKGIMGTLVASLILAMATHLGVIYVSSLWQPSIVFGVLFIFLLFRAMMDGRRMRGPKVRA